MQLPRYTIKVHLYEWKILLWNISKVKANSEKKKKKKYNFSCSTDWNISFQLENYFPNTLGTLSTVQLDFEEVAKERTNCKLLSAYLIHHRETAKYEIEMFPSNALILMPQAIWSHLIIAVPFFKHVRSIKSKQENQNNEIECEIERIYLS